MIQVLDQQNKEEKQARFLVVPGGAGHEDVTVRVLDSDDVLLDTEALGPDEVRALIGQGAWIVVAPTDSKGLLEQLREAVARVQRLEKALSICWYCMRIGEGRDRWDFLEAYTTKGSASRLRRTVCPDCYGRLIRPEVDAAFSHAGNAALDGPGPDVA